MYAATGILQKCLSKAFMKMHGARVKVLMGAVSALILGRRLVLMDIARSWPDAERVRAPLKRLDRLLGNERLKSEKQLIFGAMAKWLLNNPRPIIIVDWSDLQGHGLKYLLRAAVPVRGQALTILEEVYEVHEKQKPHIEEAFLRRLHALVPAGAIPIILTDAGFQRPWFRAVGRLGWDYVGRVRRPMTRVHLEGIKPMISVGDLYKKADLKAQRIENVGLGHYHVMRCDLVLYKKATRGRVRTTHRGKRSECIRSKRAEKSAREPWVLASSLPREEFTAQQVVNLYAKRMQIEKSFRDLKCVRYGCAFDHSLTRSCARLSVLLLIHALAAFASWLAGLTLNERDAVNQHGGVFAPRPRRHYALLRLGWEALRRSDPAILVGSLYDMLRTWAQCTEQLADYACAANKQ